MVEDAISFWTDIQRYEDMLVADPGSYCFAPLSELYRKLGLLDDAVSVAKKGCDLHPDYPGGFFALGTACYAKGLTDQARGALERAVSLNPDNLQAQKLLAQLYLEAGETVMAEKALKQILQQNPEDVESTLLLHSLEAQAVPEPDDEEILDDLEVIEELTEVLDEPQAPEAAAASGAAEAVRPREPAAKPTPYTAGELGAFEESGDFWAIEAPGEEAEPELLRAFEETQEPSAQHPARDPLTTATLAELYVTQGFIGKALAIYRELLGADPANQPYSSRCAELEELQLRQQQPQQPAPPASRIEAPAVQRSTPVPQRDAQGELNSWLENIRRRRDGL